MIYDQSWPEKTIIGGELAAAGEFPYQAYLVSSRFWGFIQSGCGGSLIQPLWVLTAAHCIHRTDDTTVHLGGTNINQMEYVQRAAFRKMHEMYDSRAIVNDVALLRLPSEPPMGESIAVIPLPAMDIGTLEGEPVVVSGYGLTSNNGESSPDLKKANGLVITNQECKESFSGIQDSNICTFYEGEPASACQGDSGGPLTYNATSGAVVVGVVSYGSSQGCDTAPVAFARVSSFLQWINTTISMNGA